MQLKLLLILSMLIVLKSCNLNNPDPDCPEPQNIQSVFQNQLVRVDKQFDQNKVKIDQDFEDTMRQGENFQGKDLQNRCRELRQDLLNVVNKEIIELSHNILGQTKRKFHHTNTILDFIKNAANQNPNIASEFLLAKELIFSLINQKIQYLNSLLVESKINQSELSLNEWKVTEDLVSVFYMKEIKYSQLKIMDETITTVCKRIENLLIQLKDLLSNTEANNVIKFKKTSIDLFNLIKILESAIPVFNSKKISLVQHKESFLKALTMKFYDMFNQIEDSLDKSQLYQSRNLILLLSKYKNFEVSKVIEEALTEKYDIFQNRYKKLVKKIPQRIITLFKQSKYTEVKIHLSQYRKIESEASHRKIISKLKKIMDTQYENIMKCLSNLNSGKTKKWSTLKQNLAKFNSYSLVVDIFEQDEMRYYQKSQQISQNLVLYYEKTKESIINKISAQEFKGIQKHLQNFSKISSILLLFFRQT